MHRSLKYSGNFPHVFSSYSWTVANAQIALCYFVKNFSIFSVESFVILSPVSQLLKDGVCLEPDGLDSPKQELQCPQILSH